MQSALPELLDITLRRVRTELSLQHDLAALLRCPQIEMTVKRLLSHGLRTVMQLEKDKRRSSI